MAYFDGAALNYSLGDEDARVEHAMLPEEARQAILIAGCGSRLLPALARRPQKLHLVDTSDAQLCLTELRLAALRTLEHGEYVAFLGYNPTALRPEQRKQMFLALPLSRHTQAQLTELFAQSGWQPIAYLGRFERMLKTLSRLNALITGKRGRDIFECRNLAEQTKYLETKFPRLAWKILIAVAGNSNFLNAILYRGEFPKKNRVESYYSIYKEIFDGLFARFPARESFFLQMVFFGHIPFPEGYPIECSPATFRAAKAALNATDVVLHKKDFFDFIAMADGSTDFLSLSDLPSFLPDVQARSYLQRAAPSLSPDALVVARGHMRLVEPVLDGFRDVTRTFAPITAEDRTMLWKFRVFQKEK